MAARNIATDSRSDFAGLVYKPNFALSPVLGLERIEDYRDAIAALFPSDATLFRDDGRGVQGYRARQEGTAWIYEPIGPLHPVRTIERLMAGA